MSKLIISIILFAAVLTSCDKETVISTSKLPSDVKKYVSKHFPDNPIIQSIEEKDGFTKTYSLILAENIKLEFNRKKEILEIDWNSKLPESVIPEKIRSYVLEHYPNQVITDWELEDKNQQVKLNDSLTLEFTKNGDFLRLDS